MDKIELVVTHQAGSPVDRHWSAIFGMAGGTVGRAGQNKLVLPDDDAMVARVHAMVRLDSDQAYIANLCERRSVQVDGLEVLSGQEVPLVPGATIGIGPYQLRALVLGLQLDAPSARAATSHPAADAIAWGTPVVKPGAEPGVSTPGASAAAPRFDLASLPNPWADIPPIVGGDVHIPDLLLSSMPEALPQPTTDGPADANPFAMLGRVEVPSVMEQFHEQPTAEPTPGDPPVSASSATATVVTDMLPAISPAEHMPPHPFEVSATKAAPAQSTTHRAMVIPDDFDPFAADPKEQALHRDPWSGDLAAKSLAEVAQLKHDDLLQALPRTGEFAGEMDNAAHTGLPQQLDPTIELNPLKLFREPGESMYAEPEDHGMSRGSDLAQVFNMPRDAQQRRVEAVAAPVPPPSAAPVVQAGLHAMQGLDLALFGGDAAQAIPSADLLDITSINARQGETASANPPAPVLQTTDISDRLIGTTCQDMVQPSQRTQTPTQEHAQLLAETTRFSHSASQLPGSPSLQAQEDRVTPAAAHAQAHMPSTAASLEALATAFLEGAAIEPGKINFAITPDFMRAFGEALRVAVQGSIDLLSARSEIKREFRADVTIIASGANNPLKFLPTADGVMLQLAGQTFPGFMKPVPAMKEAYQDLAVHQIALMAGIRAAYAEAVARLSPSALEKDATAAPGLLAKISSVHRKAALWDDFQQRYESVRRHAEDDLMAFSGQTFVNAYEAAAQSAEGHL